VHPEYTDEETVKEWLKGIVGACDNPRGSRRIPPYDAKNQPLEV
jgi:hypothetical protein